MQVSPRYFFGILLIFSLSFSSWAFEKSAPVADLPNVNVDRVDGDEIKFFDCLEYDDEEHKEIWQEAEKNYNCAVEFSFGKYLPQAIYIGKEMLPSFALTLALHYGLGFGWITSHTASLPFCRISKSFYQFVFGQISPEEFQEIVLMRLLPIKWELGYQVLHLGSLYAKISGFPIPYAGRIFQYTNSNHRHYIMHMIALFKDSKSDKINAKTHATEILKSLKQTKYNDDRCSICFEEFSEEGAAEIVELSCGHVYCRECIQSWHEKTNVLQRFCPKACNDMKPFYVIYKSLDVEDEKRKVE